MIKRIEISENETVLKVWTKDADAVYQLLGEAEDDGLRLEVATRPAWFATVLTARMNVAGAPVSSDSKVRFKSLVHRIRHIGLGEAA